MSRCLACNARLSDFEATRKTESGHYLDLCNRCFYSGVHQMINVTEREDLRSTTEEDEEETSEDNYVDRSE